MSDVEPSIPADYPREWEADVVLRDGSVAHVRPIRPDDAERIHRFHAAQSEESIYLRFFAPIKRLSDRDVRRFTHVDYVERVALVATVADDIIGIGRYDRLGGRDATSAEVAFNVADSFQGRGVGSVMLEHLAAIGAENGVAEFVADVLPQNRKMIQVFTEAGYDVSRNFDDGVISVRFEIEPNEKSQAVRLAREQRAESQSVRALLNPSSIAVVGVSRDGRSVGGRVLANLVEGGYRGTLHVVHPEAGTIEGLPTVPSISAIGEPVDLVVIAVPAPKVLDVVAECGGAGVRALLVVSAGFAESGPEGVERQAQLLALARRHGMRVVGPNSFGLINTREDTRLNASIAYEMPPAGHLGLFAQSGALGIAVLASAGRRGLGLSDFASAGNRIDVSGNDLLQYWIDDDDTHAVGLYLESVGNPRKFTRIARQLALRKPVVVVKSEVSAFGRPPGHRVRETRTPPRAFREMLRQSGVIRVGNVHQLFDVAQLVVNQPLPKGRRVAVVANSDALGALCGDAALSWKLDVTRGPVAVAADASEDAFRDALVAAFEDENVDSVVASFIPPLITGGRDVARTVAAVSAQYDKPCVTTFLGIDGVSGDLSASAPDGSTRIVPSYPMPEDGVRALAAATNYAEWRGRDRGEPVAPLGIDRKGVHEMVRSIMAESPDGRELTADETAQLLALARISVWPSVPARSPKEAVDAAEELGFPVVVKSIAPQVRHQVASALRADLRSPLAVVEAYEALAERLEEYGPDQFVVQKMATPGIGCSVTSVEDPLFGPVVSFSVSGPPTDLLDDVGYRNPPLTTGDVSELVSSIKAWPLLDGSRGRGIDRAAIEDLVARVSVLADENPEIAHLELNPVSTHPGGLDVLGARITLAPASLRQDSGRRAMT